MGGFPVRPLGGPLTVLRAEKRLREMRPAAKLSARRSRFRVISEFAFQRREALVQKLASLGC